jgi:hypothetical protein
MAVDNPWTAEFWSITAQGAYIKKYGLSVAQRTARLAGSRIGALRPTVPQPEKIIERHWIIQKQGGGGGGGGQGFSGSGAPSS